MTRRNGQFARHGSTLPPVVVGIITGGLILSAILGIGAWYLFSPKDADDNTVKTQEVAAKTKTRRQPKQPVKRPRVRKTESRKSPAIARKKIPTKIPALKLTLSDGRQILKIDADDKVVHSVALSPDGKRILAGGSETSIRVWSTQSGKLMDLYERHRNEIGSVAISSDGTRALSGSLDRSARYWNTKTGELIRVLRGHRWPVLTVAISPDGKRALTGSDGFRLWELETGRMIHHFKGHKKSVWSVAFSHDGKHALTGSYDKTMRQWDLTNLQPVRQFEGHPGLVKCACFSPAGELAASCDSTDPVIRIWEVSSGRTIRTLTGHTAGVASVAFSPDGRYLLSGAAQQDPREGGRLRNSGDTSIRLWRIDDGKNLLTIDRHKAFVTSVAFTPDSLKAVAGCGDGTIRVFELFTKPAE